MPRTCIDRAAATAAAVCQIATTAAPDEALLRITEYLRDEFADTERQIAADREVSDA